MKAHRRDKTDFLFSLSTQFFLFKFEIKFNEFTSFNDNFYGIIFIVEQKKTRNNWACSLVKIYN